MPRNEKVRVMALNNDEIERLNELGIDPENMRALIAIGDFPHPSGTHDITAGTRGGMIDGMTQMKEGGWVEEGSVSVNSIIHSFVEGESVVKNSNIEMSGAVYNSDINNAALWGKGRIINTKINTVNLSNSSVYESELNNAILRASSVVSNSSIYDSELNNSILRASSVVNNTYINHGDLVRAQLDDVRIDNSEVHDSSIWSSVLENKSVIRNTYMNNCNADALTMTDSRVIESIFKDCLLTKSTIRHAKEVYTESGHGIFHDPTMTISPVDQKFLDRGWRVDDYTDGVGYVSDDMTIYARPDGISVSMADYDEPAAIPYDVMDILAEKAQEMQNENRLELSDNDLKGLEEIGLVHE